MCALCHPTDAHKFIKYDIKSMAMLATALIRYWQLKMKRKHKLYKRFTVFFFTQK